MKYNDSEITVEGYVTIATPYKKQRVKNTILFNYFNALLEATSGTGSSYGVNFYYSIPRPSLELGTDTSTPTTGTTSSLASPISNTYIGLNTNISTDGATMWYISLSYIYNTSFFPTQYTIGEIAYYGYNYNGSNLAFSRLAVADGTFSAVTVNASTPLSINWIFEFKYGA